jgi:hypothetical protein
MKTLILWCMAALLCASCTKSADDISAPDNNLARVSTNQFIQYTIKQGEQYSDNSGLKRIETEELNFEVRFDSSAIYQTALKNNQYDINKLYGFSDNNGPHHQYSARFGWRWSNNALRLFAYVYNNGVRQSEELGTVPIGEVIHCSIKADSSQYIFRLNDIRKVLPRGSTTPLAKGYKLYPYFGGDETAPKQISIWIMDI